MLQLVWCRETVKCCTVVAVIIIIIMEVTYIHTNTLSFLLTYLLTYLLTSIRT